MTTSRKSATARYIPWPTTWTPAANCPNLTLAIYSSRSYYGTTSSALVQVTRLFQDYYHNDTRTLATCSPPGYDPQGGVAQYYSASTPLQCPHGYTMDKNHKVIDFHLITTINQCCLKGQKATKIIFSGWTYSTTTISPGPTSAVASFCYSSIPTSTTVPLIIAIPSAGSVLATTTVIGPTIARTSVLEVAWVKPLNKLSQKQRIYIAVGVVLGVILLGLAFGLRMVRKRRRRRLRYDYLAARQAHVQAAQAGQGQAAPSESHQGNAKPDIPLKRLEKAALKDGKKESQHHLSASDEQLVSVPQSRASENAQSWSNYETLAIAPIHVAGSRARDDEPIYTETQPSAHDAITETAVPASSHGQTGQAKYETSAL